MDTSWIRKIKSAVPFIDFAGQTILIMIGIFGLGVAVSIQDYGWLVILLWAQMFLGPWQMLSCLISILTKSKEQHKKKIHFVTSIIYLTLLALGAWLVAEGMFPPYNGQTLLTIDLITLIIPSWMLGIYYYVLTWRIVLPSYKKHSNFLPHINF